VTERLAREDRVNEIDLTDETTERESSGAFEPATPGGPAADPPADAGRTGSSSIFDVGERAKQEDEHPTGYEPSIADPDAGPDGPRGETVVTEPGEARDEPDPDATAPVADPPADAPDAETADAPDAETADAPGAEAADAPAADAAANGTPAADTAAADAPVAATPGTLPGSLDAGEVRNRFLDIQAGFIDEPRQAVEEAGRFVDDLLRQVADSLQQQRSQLAGATGEASTEDLRLALRAYRQFVDRLLGLAS
jgi:hypothetical protein